MMKIGICVFPGSNCDYDTYYIVKDILQEDAELIDYTVRDLDRFDAVILPGGFSFGDYLRPGALASKTPLAEAIVNFAAKGRYVLGICNGFQILTELKLLPGALLPNENDRFICKRVNISVENVSTAFTKELEEKEIIVLPIAHHDGRFYAPEDVLEEIEKNNQVVFRYEGENPNGSLNSIAGVCNKTGNVVGMMPHPERISEDILGGLDGLKIWHSLIA
ncbi:MAG: phosphoribosylformylglycinamidine synthase subunit PurQ [Hydrogenobaculum sp.]